jgi:hypothetical protein
MKVDGFRCLCIAAYGFLMLERLAGVKKTPLDYQRLPYPKASVRARLGPMQRHVPWSIATIRHRATVSAMPMLREIVPAGSA